MNTKTYKQAFVVLAVSIFIVPQIAFAAWWNPLSWSIWNIFRPNHQVQQVQIATTTIPTALATTTEKADTKVVSPQKPAADSTQKVSQPNIKQPSVTAPSQPIPTSAPSCTRDTWSCSDWLACSSSGSQTRSCSKTFECSSVVTPSPITSQSCTPTAPSCQTDTWSCGDWSSCSASGNQTRSCTKTFDCSSANTPSPASSQGCTPPAQTQTETPTLSISNINVTTNITYARIDWNTSIPTDSKILFTMDDGSIQTLSPASYSPTQHFITVLDLKSNTQYSYTIEEAGGSQVKKVTGTLMTKPAPVCVLSPVINGSNLVEFDNLGSSIGEGCQITGIEAQVSPSENSKYIETFSVNRFTKDGKGCAIGTSNTSSINIDLYSGLCNKRWGIGVDRLMVLATLSKEAPAGTKLNFCVTSVNTDFSAPVSGLPICSEVYTVPAPL